jgi:phosphate-selective porin OprO/OprP
VKIQAGKILFKDVINNNEVSMIRKQSKKLQRRQIFFVIFCLLVIVILARADEEKEEFAVLASRSLELSAYTQVRYTHSDEDLNEFRIRRARAGLKGEILKKVNYILQIDAAKSPVLLDAEVEIAFSPHAILTFGQFKVPFSLENLTSSSALDTINRSQTVRNLCPGRDIGAQGRDIGVALSGKFSRLEYSLGVFNGEGANRAETNEKKDLVVRLGFSPFDFLTLSLSNYQGKSTLFGGDSVVDRDRTGIDIYFVHGQISLKGEYISARDYQTDKCGWYLQGGYYLVPDKIQALARYDSFDLNLDIQGDRNDVLLLGLNWFFSKKTKLQINYEHHQEGLTGTSENVILAQFQAGF